MVGLQGNEELFRLSMNQGHSAAWDGRWQEAVEHYSRALEEFPNNPPTMNSLALAHFELNHLDQALELYKRAARLAPKDPLPVEKTAEIYKQTGQLAKAIEYSFSAAELYIALRDAEKAINNWTRIIQLGPENIEAHQQLATMYEKLGRTPQAITEFIAVAALQQHAGLLQEAKASGARALKLNPKNEEAQQAVAMLQDFKSLPMPIRMGPTTGPLRLPPGFVKPPVKTTGMVVLEDGPDPIEEAKEKALQTLASILFDVTPGEADASKKGGGLRSIAKVVSEGILARGFDEKAIVRHLSKSIDLQTKKKFKNGAEELKKSIEAGLDHPAAHFNLGMLSLDEGRSESAQRSFQKAVKSPEFAMAAHLLLGDFLREQSRFQDAVVEYLGALKFADIAVVPQERQDMLRQQYDPLIAKAQALEEAEAKMLSENIRHLLLRSNWRIGMNEARDQLPGSPNGAALIPVANILNQADSGRLVDALARINQISRAGHLRAAMEEAFGAMKFSPSYLPLHIHMAELLMMNQKPQQAIEKLATVARVYSSRGETNRATQMYQRIVTISPLDVDSRTHLIDQLTEVGNVEDAATQLLELADVFYRQAQLDKARETYEKALRLTQSADVDAAWQVQILHQMADIDLQRLDWRKALRVYEQLRTLSPNDEAARVNLVQLNLRLGLEAKANAELDNYLSYMNSRGQDKDAGTFLIQLVKENSRFVAGFRRLAEHHQQMGQREEAIRAWNKVGEFLVEAGDREGAKAAVRAILSLNPPNPERYQQFLQRLSK